MNKAKALLVILAVIACGGESTAAAPAASKDPQFEAFYAKFKAAVVKRDKATIATLTKLPFMYDYKFLDKTKFVSRFNEIFPK
jgi:hypothetical protein